MVANLVRLVSKWAAMNYRVVLSHRERRGRLGRDSAYWTDFRRLVFEESQPVFVLSTGRCGTELLTRIFDRVPAVCCYHQPQPELSELTQTAFTANLVTFAGLKLAARAARFELVADSFIRERRYIETNNRITFLAPQLAELFQNSLFIHLVRHPGSFVRSAVNRGYYQGQYTDLGRITPVTGLAAEAWPSLTSIERSAWLWNATNQFIEGFKSRQPDRVLTIRAEDLFSRPQTVHDILSFSQLPELPEKQIQKLQRHRVNAQPPKPGDLPDYKKWNDQQKAELSRWSTLAGQYEYAV